MEIIKSELSMPRKCEYGDFELKPEEGWKVSYSFIDYESGLLIVSVSITDKSKWTDNGYGARLIPTREYKIDLKTLSILTPEEWRKLFNYNKVEIISDDKKYKLISQRVVDPETNNDGYREELYELSSGKRIRNSHSIAFHKNKRENLLERFCRAESEKEKQKRILDAKPDLEQFYWKQLEQIKNNEIIVYYYDNLNVYRLTYLDKNFILSVSGPLPSDSRSWKFMEFTPVKSYPSIDDFWREFTADPKWFVRFNHLNRYDCLSSRVLVLAKHMNSFFNDLRRSHNFTYKEYNNINNWSLLVWSDDYKNTELKQWCPNCFKEVLYQVRYPKYICSDCFSKDKFDSKGNLLEFSNLGISGGLRITYKDSNGNTISEDETQEYCECIIDNKLFFAKEAKFGGIVIQKKE